MIRDVSAAAAWQALQTDPDARLCDVRTDAEWQHVGVPAGPVAFVSWQVAPSMQVNATFIDDLRTAGLTPDDHVYFICRSGVRSHAAAQAAQQAGYAHVYNVAEGFEGRPGVAGWAAQGLPVA